MENGLPIMKTFHLIRHAQSAANAGGISRPEREIPLSGLGKEQAAALVFRLPENRPVLVSEMRRTRVIRPRPVSTNFPVCRLT